MKKLSLIVLIFGFNFLQISCTTEEGKLPAAAKKITGCGSTTTGNTARAGCPSAERTSAGLSNGLTSEKKAENTRITFIELGSVNCIPCKKMQPVMKAIAGKYGEQIEVIFYDVWEPEQRRYAEKYGIRLIPTQIFLDQDGVELMRHEGFLPEGEIDQFLKEQGLSPKEKS